jgi:hypothetical protein
MAKTKGETLDLLRTAYDALTKAGRHSLEKAYAFGNVVNALHGIFTYRQLGEELGVTQTTVSKYDKLYQRYSTLQLLLSTATEIGCYDVSVLAGGPSSAQYRYLYQCTHCGSFEVQRERETPELLAAKMTEAATAAGTAVKK